MLKELFDHHRTFVNVESLGDRLYSSFFYFFWMKISRSLTIKNHDKKKKHWSDKTLQPLVESCYSYYNNFVIEKLDFNHVMKI